ncbi:RlmE family RNA methyltransferase [Neisseria sp. Ec49-e6-T10]|uniref:RlmE family RNA methyltransferase n=1 Tax=Neisseria sp. Ec49-e6-T10 TaxID=3140744 RepID=UPI003EBFFDA6
MKSNRSKSSKAWLSEHVHDVYVHQAKQAGYRARSAYKFLEINEKDNLIHSGDIVVDLGSAPGSWSQVAQELVGEKGQVFALDILPMEPIEGVQFIQGDFREEDVLLKFEELLNNRPVDLVISDMAPNMSGQAVTDQARSYYLAELALDFAQKNLTPEGGFLVKVFQGSEQQSYMQAMRAVFCQVQVRKPKASRDRSSEIYLLGKKLR